MSNRVIIVIAILSMLSVQLWATVIPADHKHRLTGGWEFIRQDMGDIWEVVRPATTGQPESVPLWTPVTLPHCWNAEDAVDPSVNYYQGAGWYRTNIEIDNPYPNGRVLLEFEGAGQRADVYVYTTKVGTHIGGYDGWMVDITDAAREFAASEIGQKRFGGKVPVSVRCDNSRNVQTIPSDMSDFTLYGGLYRYVNLVYVPQVSFANLRTGAHVDNEGKRGTLNVATTFYNPTHRQLTGYIELLVKDPAGKIICTQNDTTTFGGEKQLETIHIRRPMRWDVDNPARYTCQLTLRVDGQTITATEQFGFRHFEFQANGPFFLNGRRLLLKGTHRHEDHAGVGAAMTEEMIIAEMKLIKAMGANFIRLGHYQQSDIVLRLCDELGLLVWEEIPWCRGGLGGEAYKEQARRMLGNMIGQHRNHPSVILWGLGNENDWPGDFEDFSQADIRAFMSELHQLSHSLDSTRLTAIRRCEFCKDIIDVYAPSIWAGWYSRKYTDYEAMSRAAYEATPRFFHAEWGGDSHVGRHTDGDFSSLSNAARNGDWSETYIARLFDWHLSRQMQMPWLTGSAFWTFKDFATPLRPENPIPYVNQKGVVERDLTPKEVFYVVQSWWSAEPMLHIYGHSWPVRGGDAGEKKEVLVYSNCVEVELFVNGVSQGKRKRDAGSFPAAGLRWEVVYHEGMNELTAKAYTGKRILTDTIHQQYQTARWGTPARLELSSTPLLGNELLVEVWLTDANGAKCLDNNDYVEWEIAGNLELMKNQGTSTGSGRIQMANGRASIRVRKNDCSNLSHHSALFCRHPLLPSIFSWHTTDSGEFRIVYPFSPF